MSDVSKIMGPSGKPEPSVELKSIVNPEEFKQMMQQVQKTDPDEQKKRKQQEEETEEAPPEPVATEPEEPDTKEGGSFLDVQKSSTPTSVIPSDQAISAGKGYAPSLSSVYTPSVEESEGQGISVSGPKEGAEISAPSQEPVVAKEPPASVQKPPVIDKSPPSESQDAQPVQPETEPVPIAPISSFSSSVDTAMPETVKPAPSLAELIAMMPPEEGLQELPSESATVPEKVAAQAPLHAIMQEPKTQEVNKTGQKGAAENFSLFDSSFSEIQDPIIAPPSELGANDPYARLPTAIQELFTRMLGVITVMNLTPGVTETTFILNSPQFASSVFFGSQIIIKEFSTAPKEFNIQLNGSQQATSVFQSNINHLADAFRKGDSSFRVNRLETGYLEAQDTEDSGL